MAKITQEKSEAIAAIILHNLFIIAGSQVVDDVAELVENGINCGRYYRHIAADICTKIGISGDNHNVRKIAKTLRYEFPEGE